MANSLSSDEAVLVYCPENLQIVSASNVVGYIQAKNFVNDIPKLFKNVKAVILHVFDHKPIGYETNLEFCKAAKEKLDLMKIKYRFYCVSSFTTSFLFISANVSVQLGETVLLLMIDDDKLVMNKYEFTKNGYKEISDTHISIDRKMNANICREKILGSSHPAKILLFSENPGKNANQKYIKTVLKSEKLFVFDKYPELGTPHHVTELSKFLLEKNVKFHVLPRLERNYFLGTDTANCIFPLNNFARHDPLPYSKVQYFSSLNGTEVSFWMQEREPEKPVGVLEFIMAPNCHRNIFTFTVDADNFPTVIQETYISKEIVRLAFTLETEIPVIGFLDNLSVIYVSQNGSYNFLDSWNGMFGKQNLISFDQKKPKFCDDALEIHYKKSSSVVYDLIKIMSMPVDKIEVDKTWPFKFTKDEKNPVLLEFDSFDGSKKAASPAFLMAMILREQLKAIKAEIGEKPEEIGFAIFDEFNNAQNGRVREQLEKACELLKIDCIFV